MAIATFDFPNLRIILPAGDSSIDVERDLYSAWKRAALVGDNTKYPPAFRTSVGGDELTPGIESGAYFFLQNQDGWRVRPAEEDATVNFIGNLIAEEATLDILTPTLGNFSVLINGLQPITQSVDALLIQQQNASYNGSVVIDTINGSPGTIFPIGTFSDPVDNLTDALAIAANVGADAIVLIGSLTLDQNLTGFTVTGSTGEASDIISLGGFDVSDSAFLNLEIQGAGTGLTQTDFCRLSNVSGVSGVFRQTGILNTITLVAGTYVFISCYSEVPGLGKPILDCNGANVQVSIRSYSGGLDIRNMTIGASNMTIDCVSAAPLIASSCTAGAIVVRGVGNLTNNTGGTTVTKDGFVDGLDVKLIKALDAGNVVITGSNPFIVEVLDPDDNVTPIARFEVTPDGRTRTRTL